jgi:cell division protein ZapA (FtsZ GTPase activity inhibitor)
VLLVPVNEYKVTIRGMKYFMKTDKDIDFVNRVVDMLNGKMNEIERMANAPDTQKLAVMAAFSFAAECMELRDEKGSIMSKVVEMIDKTA